MTTYLIKEITRSVVPSVKGQPFIPASYDCYPPPPDPPKPPDDGIGTQPGSNPGNGSGPSHGGCYTLVVTRPQYVCFQQCLPVPHSDPPVSECYPATCQMQNIPYKTVTICP